MSRIPLPTRVYPGRPTITPPTGGLPGPAMLTQAEQNLRQAERALVSVRSNIEQLAKHVTTTQYNLERNPGEVDNLISLQYQLLVACRALQAAEDNRYDAAFIHRQAIMDAQATSGLRTTIPPNPVRHLPPLRHRSGIYIVFSQELLHYLEALVNEGDTVAAEILTALERGD